MTVQRRAQHEHRCGVQLDRSALRDASALCVESVSLTVSFAGLLLLLLLVLLLGWGAAIVGTIDGPVFFCVVCGVDLCDRDELYRTRHLKDCAASHNTSAAQVRQLQRAKSNPTEAFSELMSAHRAPPARARSSNAALNTLERNLKVSRSSAQPPSKRRRERSPLTLEEDDVQLARALSLSEATSATVVAQVPATTAAAAAVVVVRTPPPPDQSHAQVLTPTLPASRFAALRRPIFELNSQSGTFQRLCSELGVASTQTDAPPPSPPATLSQLVALVSPTPQQHTDSQRFSPVDDRPDAVNPDAAAADDDASTSVLRDFTLRLEARRQVMRERCAELNGQIRKLQAAIAAEQLACNTDIAQLQRERDDKLRTL
jgi:hypothetical protein